MDAIPSGACHHTSLSPWTCTIQTPDAGPRRRISNREAYKEGRASIFLWLFWCRCMQWQGRLMYLSKKWKVVIWAVLVWGAIVSTTMHFVLPCQCYWTGWRIYTSQIWTQRTLDKWICGHGIHRYREAPAFYYSGWKDRCMYSVFIQIEIITLEYWIHFIMSLHASIPFQLNMPRCLANVNEH